VYYFTHTQETIRKEGRQQHTVIPSFSTAKKQTRMSFNDFGSSRNASETRSAQTTSAGSPSGSTALDNAVREIGEMLTRFQVVNIFLAQHYILISILKASCNSAKAKVDAAGKMAVTATVKTEYVLPVLTSIICNNE
jgi:hypothetical protein